MTPHGDQEVCLKEKEWREVHDFVAATIPYRKDLDDRINNILDGLKANRNTTFGLIAVILIPSFVVAVNMGEMKRQIAVDSVRLDRIETSLHDHELKSESRAVTNGERNRI